MIIVPWKYVKDSLDLPSLEASQLAKKLTNCGLETNLLNHKKNVYLEFNTLPNRFDLLFWQGIIYEIGVLINCRVKPLILTKLSGSKKKSLEVEAKIETGECQEFHLGLIKNIKIKKSPYWIKEILEINKIRSVNNIIDAVNMAKLETGQNLRVFNCNSLEKKLTVHSKDTISISGEKNVCLSKEFVLDSKPQGILFEFSVFSAQDQSVKNIAPRLQMFSSGKDILQIFISLVQKSYNKKINSSLLFSYQKNKQKKKIISISHEFIEKKIGQKLTEKTIKDIFKRLGFLTSKKKTYYLVIIPLHRVDIVIKEDLLEEILRVYDYNKVISSSRVSNCSTNSNNKEKIKNQLRSYLASIGCQEIITYSLVSSKIKEDFNYLTSTNFYYLLKPKSKHHEYYRQTSISSHLKTINYNMSYGNKDLFFFEISSIYNLSLEEEVLTLSGMGKWIDQPLHQFNQKIDFYLMKGLLENIFRLWRIESRVSFVSFLSQDLQDSQSIAILLSGTKIGYFGLVRSQIANKYQLSNSDIFVAQISLSKIFDYLDNSQIKTKYEPISNFPVSEKDLSFIFPESIDYDIVIDKMKKMGGENLHKINIFDVYQDTEMKKKNQKSVGFRLTFQSLFRTLEKKEIEETIKAIVQNIEKLFNANLRS